MKHNVLTKYLSTTYQLSINYLSTTYQHDDKGYSFHFPELIIKIMIIIFGYEKKPNN